jgi:hypothetical protein
MSVSCRQSVTSGREPRLLCISDTLLEIVIRNKWSSLELQSAGGRVELGHADHLCSRSVQQPTSENGRNSAGVVRALQLGSTQRTEFSGQPVRARKNHTSYLIRRVRTCTSSASVIGKMMRRPSNSRAGISSAAEMRAQASNRFKHANLTLLKVQ